MSVAAGWAASGANRRACRFFILALASADDVTAVSSSAASNFSRPPPSTGRGGRLPGGRFCMGASPAPHRERTSVEPAAFGVCFAVCRCLDFLRFFRLRRREAGSGGSASSPLTVGASIGASAAIRIDGAASGAGTSGVLPVSGVAYTASSAVCWIGRCCLHRFLAGGAETELSRCAARWPATCSAVRSGPKDISAARWLADLSSPVAIFFSIRPSRPSFCTVLARAWNRFPLTTPPPGAYAPFPAWGWTVRRLQPFSPPTSGGLKVSSPPAALPGPPVRPPPSVPDAPYRQ